MSNIFYHATNIEFEKFNVDYQATKGASNGYLGVWTTYQVEDCAPFGDIIMKLEVPEVIAYEMPIGQLSQLHSKTIGMPDRGMSMYKEFSKLLLDEGYNAIYLVEKDGRSVQAILLAPENVRIVEHFPSPNEQPSTWGLSR